MSHQRGDFRRVECIGWPVRTRSGECLVLKRGDFKETEEFAHHLLPTRFEIGEWIRDPLFRSSIIEMYESVYDHRIIHPLRMECSWLADRIHEAILRGDLTVMPSYWHPAIMTSGGGSEEITQVEEEEEIEPTSTPEPEEIVDKVWFRARLRDEDGIPMAGEDYVLVDSTGARTEGKLDANGEVYIPRILPPGNCTINFPNIHLNPRKRK